MDPGGYAAKRPLRKVISIGAEPRTLPIVSHTSLPLFTLAPIEMWLVPFVAMVVAHRVPTMRAIAKLMAVLASRKTFDSPSSYCCYRSNFHSLFSAGTMARGSSGAAVLFVSVMVGMVGGVLVVDYEYLAVVLVGKML
jgi:hypothetical protein